MWYQNSCKFGVFFLVFFFLFLFLFFLFNDNDWGLKPGKGVGVSLFAMHESVDFWSSGNTSSPIKHHAILTIFAMSGSTPGWVQQEFWCTYFCRLRRKSRVRVFKGTSVIISWPKILEKHSDMASSLLLPCHACPIARMHDINGIRLTHTHSRGHSRRNWVSVKEETGDKRRDVHLRHLKCCSTEEYSLRYSMQGVIASFDRWTLSAIGTRAHFAPFMCRGQAIVSESCRELCGLMGVPLWLKLLALMAMQGSWWKGATGARYKNKSKFYLLFSVLILEGEEGLRRSQEKRREASWTCIQLGHEYGGENTSGTEIRFSIVQPILNLQLSVIGFNSKQRYSKFNTTTATTWSTSQQSTD